MENLPRKIITTCDRVDATILLAYLRRNFANRPVFPSFAALARRARKPLWYPISMHPHRTRSACPLLRTHDQVGFCSQPSHGRGNMDHPCARTSRRRFPMTSSPGNEPNRDLRARILGFIEPHTFHQHPKISAPFVGGSVPAQRFHFHWPGLGSLGRTFPRPHIPYWDRAFTPLPPEKHFSRPPPKKVIG